MIEQVNYVLDNGKFTFGIIPNILTKKFRLALEKEKQRKKEEERVREKKDKLTDRQRIQCQIITVSLNIITVYVNSFRHDKLKVESVISTGKL